MDRTNKLALEPNLLEGDALFRVYYLPDLEIPWRLVGEHPRTHNIDEFIPMEAREVLERFPEMGALLEAAPPPRRVMLQKGRTSGKWIDFILK